MPIVRKFGKGAELPTEHGFHTCDEEVSRFIATHPVTMRFTNTFSGDLSAPSHQNSHAMLFTIHDHFKPMIMEGFAAV